MSVSIEIVDGPLSPQTSRPQAFTGAGAVLAFLGVVRPNEPGGPIRSLHYQTYEPMAHNALERLARELLEKHGLLAVQVEHSRGDVPAGEISFRLTIAAAHRKPAIVAMDEFIDRMKQDVPIWKRPGE